MRTVPRSAAAAAAVLALSGCAAGGGAAGGGGSSSSPASAPPSAPAPASARTLTVFAAASLQKGFTRIGHDFEAAHPGVRVTFSFAGSADLVSQLTAGAPADVFAAADTATMTEVTGAGLGAGAPAPFATNSLTIVTPPDDPARVASFADLARPGTHVVVCAPQVPCGAATRTVEQATGTALHPVSEESSVTDVLGKVTSGEADAGLVYVTDAAAAGGAVRSVPFPEAAKAVNTDPVVVLRGARQPALARAFAAFVTGPQGQRVLHAAGFGPPPAP